MVLVPSSLPSSFLLSLLLSPIFFLDDCRAQVEEARISSILWEASHAFINTSSVSPPPPARVPCFDSPSPVTIRVGWKRFRYIVGGHSRPAVCLRRGAPNSRDEHLARLLQIPSSAPTTLVYAQPLHQVSIEQMDPEELAQQRSKLLQRTSGKAARLFPHLLSCRFLYEGRSIPTGGGNMYLHSSLDLSIFSLLFPSGLRVLTATVPRLISATHLQQAHRQGQPQPGHDVVGRGKSAGLRTGGRGVHGSDGKECSRGSIEEGGVGVIDVLSAPSRMTLGAQADLLEKQGLSVADKLREARLIRTTDDKDLIYRVGEERA